MNERVQEIKRQWLALDAENDKLGKLALLQSLDKDSPEFGAISLLMIGLHLTKDASSYRRVGTFQRGGRSRR